MTALNRETDLLFRCFELDEKYIHHKFDGEFGINSKRHFKFFRDSRAQNPSYIPFKYRGRAITLEE